MQPSLWVDQSYDVTDYCGVDTLFGTMEQFESLLAQAHELGLRILPDVVPNSCSSEHPLLQAALAAGPGSPEWPAPAAPRIWADWGTNPTLLAFTANFQMSTAQCRRAVSGKTT